MELDHCRNCGAYVAKGRVKFCSGECRNESLRTRLGKPEERHKNLKRILERERCPKTDPLWSLRYYEALLAFNGFRCLYCHGELAIWSPTGHALDRIDNTKKHVAANCLGSGVCQECNSVRNNTLSVEDMFALSPTLRERRFRKDISRQFFPHKEVTAVVIESETPPVVVVSFQKSPDQQIIGPSGTRIIKEINARTKT